MQIVKTGILHFTLIKKKYFSDRNIKTNMLVDNSFNYVNMIISNLREDILRLFFRDDIVT